MQSPTPPNWGRPQERGNGAGEHAVPGPERPLSSETRSHQEGESPGRAVGQNQHNSPPFVLERGPHTHNAPHSQNAPQNVTHNPSQQTPEGAPRSQNAQRQQNVPAHITQNAPQRGFPNPQQTNSDNKAHHAGLNPPQRGPEASPVHGMPQPASLTSLPPSHPVSQLPPQPSPADQGDQRPSEPTNRSDSGGRSADPGMMKSGPPNGIYKQPHSPKSQQTQLGNQSRLMPRGPAPGHNPAMSTHSQGPENGAMGQYGMGSPPHTPYGPMGRPVPPSNRQPYTNQAIPQTMNPHTDPARYPTYHQQGAAYPYHVTQQQQALQGQSNMYPQYQQQHFYPQAQDNSRGGYPSEEWHRQYQPRHPMPSNTYPPAANANGRLKEGHSLGSPLGSEGSGSSLMSPSPLPEGVHGGCVEREAGSPMKPQPVQAQESSERSESPKQILDLDSHNAAARRRSTQAPTHATGFLGPTPTSWRPCSGPSTCPSPQGPAWPCTDTPKVEATSRAWWFNREAWRLNSFFTQGSRLCLPVAPAANRKYETLWEQGKG
ncbi:hypothetical protein UPYG_G00267940 [Umbra pygmaea]|uniref:Uncharacterized protein n=1 Tax=Umbra pygmaea TaxID=75934 RepID=A0ABD0WAK4_UMBPY